MTVLGVGVDMVDLDAFARDLKAPGTRFTQVFSATERRQARERAADRGAEDDVVRHLGARWAAKEAVIKAWSAALWGRAPVLSPDSVPWQRIETVTDAWGRPAVRISGEVAAAVQHSVGECEFLLSLAHEGGFATAFVVVQQQDRPDRA